MPHPCPTCLPQHKGATQQVPHCSTNARIKKNGSVLGNTKSYTGIDVLKSKTAIFCFMVL
jgi:hypothetical protein